MTTAAAGARLRRRPQHQGRLLRRLAARLREERRSRRATCAGGRSTRRRGRSGRPPSAPAGHRRQCRSRQTRRRIVEGLALAANRRHWWTLPPSLCGYGAVRALEPVDCKACAPCFRGNLIMQQPKRNLTVVDHPLVQHKLSLMRDRTTSTAEFRRLLREISLLLAYEATRDLPLETTEVDTPLERGSFPLLSGKKLCLVSILRAGNGILDGMLDLLPSARVGHIGIYREPRTLQAVEYYSKLPEDLAERDVILVDPMLATGNSAAAAISRLVELRRARSNSSASSPLPRASIEFWIFSRRSRSSPPRSTAASTSTATSCPGSATPATVCSGRSNPPPEPRLASGVCRCRGVASTGEAAGARAGRIWRAARARGSPGTTRSWSSDRA